MTLTFERPTEANVALALQPTITSKEEGWAHDAIDRKTGANWRDDSSLQVWFPYTHEELARLRGTLQSIADADWRQWEELATPDEFVLWAKSRAAHALRPNT